MSRLRIAGQVRYADLSIAPGARVTIIDRDGTDGTADDTILVATTGGDGRFSGRSSEWRDREGRVLGIDVPDVLRLDFVVSLDGRTHRGPFIRHDDRSSIPIILPSLPPREVTKPERELVQIILLAPSPDSAEHALYEFIENASEGLTRTLLGGSYRKLTFLTGAAATLEGLVGALAAATGRSGVEAVDLFFTTHGTSNRVELADGRIKMSEVQGAIVDGLTEEARTKLRVVFSTACFGATHLDEWRAAGFSDASGSEGIYADSAVSYAPFLIAWAAERTFAEAVAAANAADVGNAADQVARQFYLATGRPDSAADIDSDRVRTGSGARRLYSAP